MFVKYSNFVDNFLIGQSLASKLVVALLNKINITICKDQIWLESKTGTDPGSRSPNNEFIECRKES